ncbi:MAG TPA: ChbG/HpnK family deacetylase [Roseateles sp.]
MHAGINEAAQDLAARGRVHAVACQVGGPAWEAGAAELRQLRGVDLGLHLDLTAFPLTLPPQKLGAVLMACFLGWFDSSALRREVAAQLQRFEDAIGRPADFVDGHQHIHQLPRVRHALMAELQRRRMHPWLRNTRRPPGIAGVKPWLIEQLGEGALAKMARQAGLGQNRALLGVYDFADSASRFAALLAGWLAVACGGDLLMCHPSCAIEVPQDVILDARLAEFRVLGGPDFDALLQTHHVKLAPMSATLLHGRLSRAGLSSMR